MYRRIRAPWIKIVVQLSPFYPSLVGVFRRLLCSPTTALPDGSVSLSHGESVDILQFEISRFVDVILPGNWEGFGRATMLFGIQKALTCNDAKV